jgi:outer membrane receptor protein involved in Fe transport
MMRLKFVSALLGGASLLVIGQSAYAQSAPAAGSPAAQRAPAAEPEEAAVVDDIVVTGSRVISNGNNSPTPVTAVATETLTNLRPTSLTESVQVLPVFSGSRSQTSNASATGGVGAGNGVAAQLNLRNVGSNRNLVLMDGRRVPPTSITNIVDADVIPQMLVQRVDVVTGGVSAVYGSDAVTGVVNFITDTTFTGLRAQASAGISKYSDGAQVEAGLAYGRNLFDGRGHFEASYQYRDDEGVPYRSDRPFFSRSVVVGNGTTVPYQLVASGALSAQPFGGRITCTGACAVNGQYFASNGVLSPFVNGTTYSGTTTQSGGAGGYFDHSLKASQTMQQLYGRFDFDLTENTHFFVSLGGTLKENEFYADSPNLQNLVLNRANAFLPAAISAQIPNATFTFNKIFDQAGRFGAHPESRQLIFTTGLDGKLGDYAWNIAYTRGQTRLRTVLLDNINNQKLSAALDAVVGTGGSPVCYASTQAATASAYADCAPLNLFGPTSASAAAIDYILEDTTYTGRTVQDDIVADISGSPFSTWAGPVVVALSGEWRRQAFESTSNARPDQYADCTSLRYNCVATGARTFLYRNTFPASPEVKQSVWEVAAEANVPLVANAPFIKSFDLNLAIRHTSYDTVGDYRTWKVGGDWHVNDDLRFRATLSRDIRAPTLTDLFAQTSVVIVTNTDLKTGASNPLPSVNVSNPDLTAEIGKTATVGLVYKPAFVPGLSFAIDYYEIEIEGAITTVQGFQTAIQNGCNLTGVATYCDLIVRNSAGAVTEWLVRPINLSVVETKGVDFETNYSGELFGRRLTLRGLAAYQPHIYYRQPAVPVIDQGGVAFGSTGITAAPSWRLTGMASYAFTDALRVDVMHRWRNELKISGDPTVLFLNDQDTIDAYGQTSLNVSYRLPETGFGRSEIFFNVQNLFDTKPPAANATGTQTAPGGFGGFAITDDPIGRYFTVGFRMRL